MLSKTAEVVHGSIGRIVDSQIELWVTSNPLRYSPNERILVEDALQSPYFLSEPLPFSEDRFAAARVAWPAELAAVNSDMMAAE